MDRRKNSKAHKVYRDKHLQVIRTYRPSGYRCVGSVDAYNSSALEKLLGAKNNGSDPEIHVDLRALEFCDVSGLRAVVAAAKHAEGSHRIILHGLPPLLGHVMSIVGWGDLPGLVIARSEFPASVQRSPEDTESQRTWGGELAC